MGFFAHKVTAAEFTRDFYDRHILGPDSGDLVRTFAETIQRLIGEADSTFEAVSVATMREELHALHLAMIGTAWTHKLKPDVALAVSEFTKQYLSDIDRSDLWDAMAEYNQAVAQSATHGADPNTRAGRAKITFVNVSRANLFDELVITARYSDAVARVANRLGSKASWKTGVAQAALAIRLTQRLDIKGSDRIWDRLAAVAFGYYRGAEEAITGVRLTV